MKRTSLFILVSLIIGTTILVWRSAENIAPEKLLDTVVIGTNAEFQPFSFKRNGKITGFDIEVIEEVFKRLDKKIIFQDMPFDALIPEIQLGNIQVIAAGMTPRKEREKQASFTNPHLTSDSLIIISLATKPIHSIQDLHNKIVVVNEGYTADMYASSQPGLDILRISSANVADGIMALQSNRADAFITALNPLKPYFEKFGTDNFNVSPIKGTNEASAFAVSKQYPDLLNFIQIMLDRMETDGTLDAIKKRWGLE